MNKRTLSMVWDETRAILRPKKWYDTVLYIFAFWAFGLGIYLAFTDPHPQRTWPLFVFLFVPAVTCGIALLYTCVIRLARPRALRMGMWQLYGATSGDVWKARIILSIGALGASVYIVMMAYIFITM